MVDGHKGGFWTTLPGILTGLAALVTALSGAAIAMRDGKPDPSPAASGAASASTPANPQPKHEPADPPTPESPSRAEARDPLAEELQVEAARINAHLPTQVNPLMTLTSVNAQGRLFTAEYDVSQRTLDDAQIRHNMSVVACNDPTVRQAVTRGATYRTRVNFAGEARPLDIDVTFATCARLD